MDNTNISSSSQVFNFKINPIKIVQINANALSCVASELRNQSDLRWNGSPGYRGTVLKHT